MTQDLTIRTGDLVDLYDEGGLVCAVVMGEEKGRLKVITETGKEMRVTASRVAQRAGAAIVQAGAAAAVALRHAKAAAARMPEIDLAALWDLLVDEPKRHGLTSLTSLALGGEDDVARSAMLRALQQDRLYFTRKGDDFEARSREHVEETLKREAAEKARLDRRSAFIQRARAAAHAGAVPPVGAQAQGAWAADPHRDQIADLVELAVFGDEAASRKEAVALLEDAGIGEGSPAERAFKLLMALGIFTQDENLFVHRFHLRRSFPAEVQRAAVVAAGRAIDLEARRDLRSLHAFTIDDDLTMELDDAVSVEVSEGATLVGIHIADPDCFVASGDPVDQEAMARAATYYFPEMKLPMIPAAVAEGAASLVPGQDRPALSFLATLSQLGEVIRSEIVPSMIRSRARLTYERADELLGGADAGDPAAVALSRLRPICEILESARVAAGAVVIRAAEVDIRVDPSGGISIRRIDDRGLSRRIVSEVMILANRLAADFCGRRGLPAIYRKQAPPMAEPAAVDAAPPEGSGDPGAYDPVAVRALRRRMRRGETSLIPAPHAGLGLPAYTQATSPIRRYQDLVVHRQIKAALRGQAVPYDAEALSRIAATTDEAERAAREAERGTDEYWILRHYGGRIGQVIEGIIVSVDARRVEVELTDTLYTAQLPPRPDYKPGQRLRLSIEASRPRAGRLTLREVDA